ncbi:hypothetical protein DTO166G4_311 [Paecilomyces variotii]|nr:hypothetical protein DTO164E3_7179 [Paecilomyces variotii]KAJ9202002.1 hypothetical protein DTO032I3_3733 [Paecilomyces variotii]KAJ9217920.1 hypothetical protein DTO166G4_311 [Paecilomyces variotii]KAJ9241085.1 hypothetical protein DTO166G5_1247 [Paecilomyces variotii]KAJ9268732.1 hypothetical protein DTO212C5_5150 [Paecilomyces variotii]
MPQYLARRKSVTMADSNDSRAVVPVARSARPVSETLLNEKWDRAISSMIIKSSLGLSFGVIFSVLLFKRRAWPAWVGLGFGAGRAWEEADASFRRGDTPVTAALRQQKSFGDILWELVHAPVPQHFR